MNSTEQAKTLAVRAFFDAKFMPLPERLKATGRLIFANVADNALTSYFNRRARTVMRRATGIVSSTWAKHRHASSPPRPTWEGLSPGSKTAGTMAWPALTKRWGWCNVSRRCWNPERRARR